MGHGMQNSQLEMGRAVGRIASSAVDAYKQSEEANFISQRERTEHANTTYMQNRAQTEGQETSNRATLGHILQQDYKLREQQVQTERERAAHVRAQTVHAHSAARSASASAAMDELRNREARPTEEGGYGRGTGIGPIFPERVLRNLGDTITDIQR